MWLTPIHKTNSIVSDEIWAVNIAWRAVNTVTNTVGAVINRTSNAISKLFSWAGKVLKNGLVAWWLAAAAITFPVSAPAIYGALATGKLIKNKAEGKGRWESLGNAITRPLWADTVAKYTDFGKVGEGIKDMTIWAGSEIVKWAGELITVPLIGAKFDDTHSSTGSSEDLQVSEPSSPNNGSTSTPSPDNKAPEQAEKQNNTTPIPVPVPNGWGGENPEKPKSQKELDEEKKKAEKKEQTEKNKAGITKIEEAKKNLKKEIESTIEKVKWEKIANLMKKEEEKFNKSITTIEGFETKFNTIKATAWLTWTISPDYSSFLTWINALRTGTNLSNTTPEYAYLKFLFEDPTNGINTINNGIMKDKINKNYFDTEKDFYWNWDYKSMKDIFSFLGAIQTSLSNNREISHKDIMKLKEVLWSSPTDHGFQWEFFTRLKSNIDQTKEKKAPLSENDAKEQIKDITSSLSDLSKDVDKATNMIVAGGFLSSKKIDPKNVSDASSLVEKWMKNTINEISGDDKYDYSSHFSNLNKAYQKYQETISSFSVDED